MKVDSLHFLVQNYVQITLLIFLSHLVCPLGSLPLTLELLHRTSYNKLSRRGLLDKSFLSLGSSADSATTHNQLIFPIDKLTNVTVSDVTKLANLAEELFSSQRQVSSQAATITREKLAAIASYWAKIAITYATLKSNEVTELTRKAQNAQIESLHFASVATRLKSAVTEAENTYNSAEQSYRILSSLAKAAHDHSTETSKALKFLQSVQAKREKWAEDEKSRALRLSNFLQLILHDLKQATELAKDAHDSYIMTTQYVHFPY